MNLNLSPAETARRFGVSIKALRLYEQRGLLKPVRTCNGSTGSAWRVYGPDQIARLHQILALKRLGLSLATINQVLAKADSLEPVLALQEEALAQDAARLARALGLVKAARAKLASGDALSIDDLANLTKETVMTRLNAKEMNHLLTPFAGVHISAAEKETLRKRIDPDKAAQTMNGLIAEAQSLMEAGDHTSPAAQDIARRWGAFDEQIAGGDPDIRAKARAVWDDAMADPAVAEKMALNREIFRFVIRAVEHLKGQAK
ncbi:MAG TPA: MerR family transcriptional regulator [Rhizomicrobium sp.]|jgi:DNA-binding transcriptional MerR regulator